MNGKKVRPLTRQEVLPLAVTDADGFTALRFLRHRENTPSIPELEDQGRKALPGIEGSLLDLYHSLWSPEPGVKKEVPPARRYWKGMLEEAMKSSAFKELHAGTQLRELQSVLGTVSMGESVVGMVSEKDKEQLQKVEKAQSKADEAEAEAKGRKLQADAMKRAADQAAAAAAGAGESAPGEPGDGAEGDANGDPDGTPSNGPGGENPSAAGGDASDGNEGASNPTQNQSSESRSGGKPGKSSRANPQRGNSQGGGSSRSGSRMSPEEAQRIADELAKEAAKAEGEADAAQKRAEDAALEAEAAADDLLGAPGSTEAEQKLRELAQMGQRAIQDAKSKVEEVSKTIEAWGLDPADLGKKTIPEASKSKE